MPYRSELKRPDLKGSFPCSVCGKVFCHSSSLSRHRMQAHFKSYTCTQCNQEISSCSGNETLRSHMFRIHSISRMFMCRCCNWAYPDKTSLHIHMQSMLRNGTPGDVSVLARSSNDGPGMAGAVGAISPQDLEGSPSVSPPEACESESPASEPPSIKSSLFNNGLLNGSIFPATLSNTENFLRFASKPDNLLSQVSTDASGQNGWLSAWLANGAFSATPFNSANLLTVASSAGGIKGRSEGAATTNGIMKVEVKEDDHLTNGTETKSIKSVPSKSSSKTPNSISSQDCKKSLNGSSLDDLLEKKGLSVTRNHRNKRKASNPQQLRASAAVFAADDEDDEEFTAPPQKQNLVEATARINESGKSVGNGDQAGTVAVAGSRMSPKGVTLVDASTSPIKCCDCTVLKAKYGMVETRNRFLETKILNQEMKIDRLDVQLTRLDTALRQYEHDQEDLRHQSEMFEEILFGYQQSAVAALALLQSGGADAIPAIKKLMENLLH